MTFMQFLKPNLSLFLVWMDESLSVIKYRLMSLPNIHSTLQTALSLMKFWHQTFSSFQLTHFSAKQAASISIHWPSYRKKIKCHFRWVNREVHNDWMIKTDLLIALSQEITLEAYCCERVCPQIFNDEVHI